ncbi:MAG: Ni/Fe-hydrogenase cytochrome b subunit [Chloroflexi bacterium]|nr:Ni/Fe-hydrogenase cytochrome b subunit [Chloroflexota bacterium]
MDINSLWNDFPALLLLLLLRVVLPMAGLYVVGWALWHWFAPSEAVRRRISFRQFALHLRVPVGLRVPELSARMTMTTLVTLLLWITAAGIMLARFFWGLGTVTALSDTVPWGLWIGFDVMTGVALAAGGFSIAATVYVFRLERFRPILRPAILTALLGYTIVVLALLVDLGRWYNIWHVFIMWNPHSIMFEVAWCVILYLTVLFLEFSPAIWERLHIVWAQKLLHRIIIPLVVLGVILSTLHQSSLGSLYLIFPTKLSALWYTPILPILFFVSALAVGIAMVIVESSLSAKAFGHKPESDLLAALTKPAAIVLGIYLVLKIGDLGARGQLARLLTPDFSSVLVWLELIAGIAVPLALFASRLTRVNSDARFWTAVLVVAGVMLNRMNVAVFGFYEYTMTLGVVYWPSLAEWIVTLAIVTFGVAVYVAAIKFLPVLPSEHEGIHA